MKSKTKTFRCDCDWPRHHLQISADSLYAGDFPYLWIAVVNETPTFLSKLKACWNILMDRDEYLSEIYLHRDDIGEFAKFVNDVCQDGDAGPLAG